MYQYEDLLKLLQYIRSIMFENPNSTYSEGFNDALGAVCYYIRKYIEYCEEAVKNEGKN